MIAMQYTIVVGFDNPLSIYFFVYVYSGITHLFTVVMSFECL